MSHPRSKTSDLVLSSPDVPLGPDLPAFFGPLHPKHRFPTLSFDTQPALPSGVPASSFDLDFDLASFDYFPLPKLSTAPPNFDLPPENTLPIPFGFEHDEIASTSPPDLCYRTETKKIYVCTYKKCNKRFNRIHELHRHHRGTHEKILPFPCRTDGCARAKRGFPRKDKRNDHERKMHGLSAA
jgi:hypothetical protein